MTVFVNHKIASQLSKLIDDIVIPLPSYEKLDLPVNSHADMLMSVIDDRVFVYKDYYEQNREVFDSIKDHTIVQSSHVCNKNYPNDIGLNVLVMGKKIFCNSKFVAKELLDFAVKKDYKIIDVKQGYSCCSALSLDGTHAITTDYGMYKALQKEAVSALLISSDEITLDGYNCGFIGGSGGIIKNKVIFFGDIKNHKDYVKIKCYLDELNFEILSLFPGGVSDFGGFKAI